MKGPLVPHFDRFWPEFLTRESQHKTSSRHFSSKNESLSKLHVPIFLKPNAGFFLPKILSLLFLCLLP